MRTIAEIKDSITAEFMGNESVARAYGFSVSADFEAFFGKVSVENVLFFVFATSAWVLENLFYEHKREVNARIEEIMPHRPKWYRDKVLAFMKNKALIADTDKYDTEGMSEADIAAARVIKHAVAAEREDASMLTIKVAGENGGKRCKLDAETETQLAAYIGEVKDAGVRINLVNIDPDTFNCTVDIYYDPMLLPEDVEADCREAIKNYIENLPFNGEYTNMTLVDKLQEVEGVKVVEFKSAETAKSGTSLFSPINGRHIPVAGYYTINELIINMQAYGQV